MDERLRDLISQVCQYEIASLERQQALNRLLRAIAQLPGIYKSSHQDYPEAFNRTLEWVCKNIDRFEVNSPSVQKSFVVWINGYLKWRIRDLYIPDDRYSFITSNDADGAIDLIESIPDPKFSIGLLDLKIAEMQATKLERQGLLIKQYIERDPENILSTCHLRKDSQCHCHLLASRLLIAEPPQSIADVSRELNVNNQTIYSHWKQKCLPLLQEIARRFGDLPQ
ncbi:MAG: hypothetical protein KME17_08865 [Cyanosarcina radialis HA8281-LM2]|nr:hypothetical protein [Cyanosarcina radialis HA8281-LM2]